jgi:hypothetical protein
MRNLSLVLLVLVAVGQIGCKSQSGAPSEAELQAYNKKHNIDTNKVNQFLSQLAAVPATERRDFLYQHPDDMRTLGLTRDPELQLKFRQIVNKP